MRYRPRDRVALVLASIVVMICRTLSLADDADSAHQLGLADLVAYHAALTGKAKTDDASTADPAIRVGFKDLWNQPETFRGRRVLVEGRVQRVFRQGPVGTFPALAEVWIVSPAGDPFCLVFPQDSGKATPVGDHPGFESGHTLRQMPQRGQMAQFTGIFLKIVSFAAGDGTRLAPLIVGNQQPHTMASVAMVDHRPSLPANYLGGRWTELSKSWLLGLTLAFVVAGALAIRQFRLRSRRADLRKQHRRSIGALGPDPPLEFVESHDQS